jgi:hypothetical protein
MAMHSSYGDDYGQDETSDLVRSLALSSAKLWEELFARLQRLEHAQLELRALVEKIDVALPAALDAVGLERATRDLPEPVDALRHEAHHQERVPALWAPPGPSPSAAEGTPVDPPAALPTLEPPTPLVGTAGADALGVEWHTHAPERAEDPIIEPRTMWADLDPQQAPMSDPVQAEDGEDLFNVADPSHGLVAPPPMPPPPPPVGFTPTTAPPMPPPPPVGFTPTTAPPMPPPPPVGFTPTTAPPMPPPPPVGFTPTTAPPPPPPPPVGFTPTTAPPMPPPPPVGFTVIRPIEPAHASVSVGHTNLDVFYSATEPRRSADGAGSANADTKDRSGPGEEPTRLPAIAPDFFARAGRRRH